MAKKKKISQEKTALWIVLGLIVTTVLIYYFNKPGFKPYPAFGIDLPSDYNIHGIDVSRYQQDVDWNEVKEMQVKKISIRFCFIKATEGADDMDISFIRNWKAAKKAGVTRGAYHYFNPTKNGKSQAENFIAAVKLTTGDLPPVLDIEQTGSFSKKILLQNIKDWLTVVEQHYRVKPIIYTGAGFYTKYLDGDFDEYPLWVAHYLVRDRPRVNRSWTFWQHNKTGHVNGINAFVDFNVFNGDSTAFQKLLYK